MAYAIPVSPELRGIILSYNRVDKILDMLVRYVDDNYNGSMLGQMDPIAYEVSVIRNITELRVYAVLEDFLTELVKLGLTREFLNSKGMLAIGENIYFK